VLSPLLPSRWPKRTRKKPGKLLCSIQTSLKTWKRLSVTASRGTRQGRNSPRFQCHRCREGKDHTVREILEQVEASRGGPKSVCRPLKLSHPENCRAKVPGAIFKSQPKARKPPTSLRLRFSRHGTQGKPCKKSKGLAAKTAVSCINPRIFRGLRRLLAEAPADARTWAYPAPRGTLGRAAVRARRFRSRNFRGCRSGNYPVWSASRR
jgi:hypothetical protein